MRYKFTIYQGVIFLLSLVSITLNGQVPFDSKGQVYVLDEQGRSLIELKINPQNNGISFETISPDYGISLNAIGMRRTDNLLYAIGESDNQLYQLDANGDIRLMGAPDLNSNESFKAGDFTSDGRYFVVIGSIGSSDISINRIDLTQASLPVDRVEITGASINLVDINSDPTSSFFYGYDQKEKRILRFNPNSAVFSGLAPIMGENSIDGIYFDAFGVLRAYGSTLNGIVSGLFEINLSNGVEQRLSTGPLLPIADMASSPYHVVVSSLPSPQTTFPCTVFEYDFRIANRYGQTISGANIRSDLPFGFYFDELVNNPLGGTVISNAGDNFWEINNITIPPGESSLTVAIEIDDIPEEEYFTSARISGLPVNIGEFTDSDDPRTLARFDRTRLNVIRVEEDSIFNDYLICQGSTIDLDATGYGGNIEWSDGSTETILTVGEGGIYSFDASSDCQTVHVQNVVTVATCPFTVEISLDIVPRSTFKCSEILYHYILENDSGESRPGVGVVDTLPEGFEFLSVVSNPYGGEKVEHPDPQIVQFDKLELKSGKDTITISVYVSDVEPQLYSLRSKLINLPAEIGTFRESDDPTTISFDSTQLEILGTGTDSLLVSLFLCPNEEIELNAAPYGTDFFWYDGLTDSSRVISQSGFYDLDLFNGCDSVYVAFDVEDGPGIEVTSDQPYEVLQGDSVQLITYISNDSDSLSISWYDPMDTTLSCTNCISPWANTLFSANYQINANNEICDDSLLISLVVDNTRLIFTPNIFSPNGDQINDIFTLSSPYFGIVKEFEVIDRWGNVVFKDRNVNLNQANITWDGYTDGKLLNPGVYIWHTTIEFIDRTVESFQGTVTLLK